ncbi:hypothetical protein NVP1155O_09 [Vibrio phage 1.155.O._10N.222.55.B3]|nr:hypothetical protein NVP1155O_09 [Vibrio phage 1.155.O._10N.222.55.B3]
MFKTLNEVPEPIRSFYFEDVVSEPTGEMVEVPYNYIDENGDEQSGTQLVPEMHDVTYIKLKDFGQTHGNPNILMRRNELESNCLTVLGFANNGQDKAFHDTYIAWMGDEPEYVEWGAEGVPFNNEDDIVAWRLAEPVRPPHKVLSDYDEYVKYRKLQGVEFEGVMCSATKEDMWGLNSVHGFIVEGNAVNFEFDNGSVLKLTADNVEAFYAVWSPFRASFFS